MTLKIGDVYSGTLQELDRRLYLGGSFWLDQDGSVGIRIIFTRVVLKTTPTSHPPRKIC